MLDHSVPTVYFCLLECPLHTLYFSWLWSQLIHALMLHVKLHVYFVCTHMFKFIFVPLYGIKFTLYMCRNASLYIYVAVCVNVCYVWTYIFCSSIKDDWCPYERGILHVAIPCLHPNLEIIKGNEKGNTFPVIEKAPILPGHVLLHIFCGPRSTKDLHKRLNEWLHSRV